SGADLPCGGGSIVWLGNTPDWHNPANWSTGSVPSLCAHHISIPVTPNNPVITSSVTVGNIQIADNVSVTICGTCVLNVCGNITDLPAAVNASFTGGGKVVLNGSVAHGLSGKLSFSTLQLNNLAGAGILATAQVDIHEYLELRQGNLNVAGVLNFKSPNEHHSAILDNFSPGFSGTITGNVRAERGYAAATATSLYSQHYFSSPINNVPFSQFAPLYGSDGVYVTPTANCDETQLEANSNYGNVFEYDESNVTTCNLQAWKVRSSGNAQNGKGYSVVKNGSGVLTLTGIPNLGNYSISGLDNSGWNITTLQMNNYQGGWHLLGNPYLAALDLDYSLNGGFDDNVLVLHTHGPHAGTYQPLSMSSNDVLAPFQGFFARKSLVGTSPETFNIQQANRRRTQTAFHKNGAHQMSLEVEGNGYADITYFNFDENSTNGFDPEYDGGKFRSFEGQPTIYSLIGGVWASVNTNTNVASTPRIPVGFSPGKDGTFRITASGFEGLSNTTVYLEDRKEKVMQNLSQSPNYIFVAHKNDNQERFVLHFQQSPVSKISDPFNYDLRVTVFPNPATGMIYIEIQDELNKGEEINVEIVDVNGKVVQTNKVLPNKGIDISLLAPAVYQIKISTSIGTAFKRLVKE
ncbi:MAG: T9SS type A sorting domain-containing protein, partial [Chitinophagales bacterium]|nr:T9SS type A sorting domain-containing protein [Chitinophagales bacterium]